MTSATKYPLALRVLHWLMAALILGLIAVGFYMADLPADAADKYDLYPTHKALGFIVLVLLLLRIPSRLKGPIPKLPTGLAQWESALSHSIHGLLYLGMIAMTVSGYLMSSTYLHSDGLDIFGLFTVPDLTSKSEYWNGIFHTIHEWSAWAISGALVLHLAGVIKHRFVDAPERDVLQRMM